ncbi:hypothetical protein HDV63DRAFT_94212 [Trichoderma sp. SZMC 28014]
MYEYLAHVFDTYTECMLCKSPATYTPPFFFSLGILFCIFFSLTISFTTHRASIVTTTKGPRIFPPSINQRAPSCCLWREAAIRAIWLRLRIAQLVARAQTAGTKIWPNQPARPRATTEIIRLPHAPLT